jgi:hypothetical protein
MFGETTLAPDGFTGPCTFVYAGDPLPTGLTFAQESPISADVSGIPTVSGTFYYNITVTSANNRVAIFYYRLITFGFTNANPPSGATTTPYTFDFTASGGTAPLTFSIISGSLPDGLSMNSAGHVSGTPTTNQTSTFEVQVVDSSTDQEICSRSYSIAISDGECAGVPSNIADLTWTISPADPGNTMAGGTGTFNALSPGVGPCFQLSTSQGFTSRICNPTDNPVTLTWHIPAWEADGNVCNYIAGQDGVIFNMELYDSIPGSGSSIQSPLRDLVTGPFTPFTLSLVLPAHSVKHILLELIVRCSPDTGLGGVQILSLGNMTLT